jgi:hypothetical protein
MTAAAVQHSIIKGQGFSGISSRERPSMVMAKAVQKWPMARRRCATGLFGGWIGIEKDPLF